MAKKKMTRLLRKFHEDEIKNSEAVTIEDNDFSDSSHYPTWSMPSNGWVGVPNPTLKFNSQVSKNIYDLFRSILIYFRVV